jgi:hypothetical protein
MAKRCCFSGDRVDRLPSEYSRLVIICRDLGEWNVTDLIEDDQVIPRPACKGAPEQVMMLGFDQFIDEKKTIVLN